MRSYGCHMVKLRTILFAAPLLLVAQPAFAQQQDEQLWLQANTNIGIGPGLRVTLEQIARFSRRLDGLYQTELGGLIGRRIGRHFELGVGYRYVGFYNGNTSADEHRTREQVVATFGPVVARFRVDERFRTGGGEVGFRIRPLLRYNYRLRPNGLAAFVSHESFYNPNTTSWGQRRGYERMRNIIGLTIPLGGSFSADVGYLNQFRPGRSGARDQMDHALTVQLTFNLDSVIHPHADD